MFIERIYYTSITAFAQVVLTQRFDILHQFEYVYLFLPLQNLRNNEEEQMGRGRPIYSHHGAGRPWSLYYRSRCGEPRSILPLHRIDVRVRAELMEHVLTDVIKPTIHLESYHVCLVIVQKALVFVQRSLALTFGEQYVTLPILSRPSG